ncbi:MAG: phenylalanine--tRNA ligase subunit alpha [Flavobacteriia bacterium]|nr:phenylalanine--tRNA ligase subunit alpha [Flavobacteriia bacterium]
MLETIERYSQEVHSAQFTTKEEVEAFRIQYLGNKGILKDLYAAFKNVGVEEKKTVGLALNEFKKQIEEKISSLNFQDNRSSKAILDDFTKPSSSESSGSLHPISIITYEIIDIFERIGFSVSEGPEVEDDWHNFSALNFPEDHPARDMQDTFFLSLGQSNYSLRTHTSSVQVRVMEEHSPPIRTISPGRVYRNEAISARAHCFFHQLEGLYIDKDVTFADLKQTLDYFAKALFGKEVKLRLRPSYFPFTEPSAEVDVSCTLCAQKGCSVCKYTGWLEIMGCGMVDPNVLSSCGIDPNTYTGFAFGMGIERITQLKYRVNDLRLYSENDVRFLQQFKS